jgi:hypothetical protein
MTSHRCSFCDESFTPCRYHPEQRICSRPDCQRRRRAEYHAEKLKSDPAYREQCQLSQRKWREQHPEYLKKYRERRRAGNSTIPSGSRIDELLDALRQNSALDMNTCAAKLLFVCPEATSSEKNIFAKKIFAAAEVVVIRLLPNSLRPLRA